MPTIWSCVIALEAGDKPFILDTLFHAELIMDKIHINVMRKEVRADQATDISDSKEYNLQTKFNFKAQFANVDVDVDGVAI